MAKVTAKNKKPAKAVVTKDKYVGAFGAKLFISQGATNSMDAYLNLGKTPVKQEAIYGCSLKELISQLSVLAQMLGSVELLRVATEHPGNKTISKQDQKVVTNLTLAVDMVHRVILEKFTQKPR